MKKPPYKDGKDHRTVIIDSYIRIILFVIRWYNEKKTAFFILEPACLLYSNVK